MNAIETGSSAIPLQTYLRGLVLWWLVPLALLTSSAVGFSILHLNDGRDAEAQRWARHLANEVDLDLAKRLEGLRAIVALADSKQNAPPMANWHRAVQAYDQRFGMPVMLVNDQHKILQHSRLRAGSVLPDMHPPSWRPALQKAVDSGHAQVDDPVVGPILGRPVVPIILPIAQQGQALMGLVSTDALQALLLNPNLPQGWHASLLDSFGRTIATTGRSEDAGLTQNDRRAHADLTTAPFRVVLDASAGTYYKESLFLGSLVLFGLILSLLLIAQGAKRASLGLTAAVRQLVNPQNTPASSSAFPKIQEIEAARQAALGTRAREHFLVDLGDILRPLKNAAQIKDEGCKRLAEFLKADHAFFAEFNNKSEDAPDGSERLNAQQAPVVGEHQLADLTWALKPLHHGQTLAISDTQASDLLTPDERQMCADVAAAAYLGAPIVKDDGLVAVLCVTQARPRAWRDGDSVVVKEVGARVWAATARALTLEALAARTLELTAQTRQLRWLASELTLAEHKTRELLSKTLHDHLQQILFSTSLTLQRAIAKSAGDPILEQAKQGLKEAMDAARALSLEIFPPVLRSEGLASALQWLATWTRKKYGLAVEVSADPQADPHALDVRILLFECVRELLFNAVKHARANLVSIKLSAEAGPTVQILLTDDGVGFDPQQALKPGGEALGLGLFSIQERLTLLGGQMRVDSAPNHGARFTLRVPQQPALAPLPEHAVTTTGQSRHDMGDGHPCAVPHSGSTLRILLVDDHAMVRDGLRQLIASHAQLEVVGEAVNGMQAIEKARELRPDVVVMDRSMPVLDGVGATRKILAEFPQMVIFGMSMDEGVVPLQFEKAGAAAFFSKKDGAELLLKRLALERLAKVRG